MVVAGTAGLADTGAHTVRRGETASEIAAEYGTSVSALVAANSLRDPNRIIEGQVLAIPGVAPAAPTTATHTVVAGENLASIARRYGTSTSALASTNGISNPNLVRIGQQLTVPVGGGPTGSGAYAATGGADGDTGVTGTHVVSSGETLVSIARRYGVDPLDLAAANGILPPHLVYSTARLQLDAANRLPNDLAACPVPGATYFNDWGFPRSGGRAHEGNDLFAARGTPVLAPVAGTVTTSTGAIGGRQFRLTTADGTIVLGSHMDSFGATGAVAAGTVIGSTGTTGNAAGGRAHLHFEVHPGGGAAMNPYPLVRQVCG